MSTLTFKQRIEYECVVESAIAPTIYKAAVSFVEDCGRWEPNDELGYTVSRFWETKRPHSFRELACFRQESGELWQAKPENPQVNLQKSAQRLSQTLGRPVEKSEVGGLLRLHPEHTVFRKYETPLGAGSTPYLPPVTAGVWRQVAIRYRVECPAEVTLAALVGLSGKDSVVSGFWDWVAANPEIGILFTEGGKKVLAALSLGYAAIGFYGFRAYQAHDPILKTKIAPRLMPEVQRFIQPGRRAYIAFDQDEKAETRHDVEQGRSVFASLLTTAGCDVRLVLWDGSLGKGIDDFIVTQGAEAFAQLIDHAKPSAQHERARQRAWARQKRENEYQAWLGQVATLAGLSEDADRMAIAKAFRDRARLSGTGEVGHFPQLTLPAEGDRQLIVLDGSKMTRKTSVGLRSVVEEGQQRGWCGVIFAPTRQLATNLAYELDMLTIDHYLALPPGNRPANIWLTACPESAHKLCSIPANFVGFDEANECIPRLQSGELGNHPELARQAVKDLVNNADVVGLAQDGIYRPTIAAAQRWGSFDSAQVKVLRRQRPKTEMEIALYLDHTGNGESWDGAARESTPKANNAFYTWFMGIENAVSNGQNVIIPSGSEGKARTIHRVLRGLHPDLKGHPIDGKYTPHRIRAEFAKSPTTFAPNRDLAWLPISPAFNSGISIEGTYFDQQFEYARAFETASSISQRGERNRDAIRGEKIKRRNVYIASRGLASMPDPAVFTANYWRSLLAGDPNTDAINLAQQMGCTEIASRLSQASADDWQDLPEFLAIQAQETYFKVEFLRMEWESNGWEVKEIVYDPTAAETWSQIFYEATQDLIAQKGRTLAKAKGKKQAGDEPAGAIEATKHHKWELQQKLGDYPGLNNSEWIESWVIDSGTSGLFELRVRSLVCIAHEQPALWAEIARQHTLNTIARAGQHDTADLPCTAREFAITQLLKGAPGLYSVIKGQLTDWTNKDFVVAQTAAWARENSVSLTAASSNHQRIHGLQFTSKTPLIKCFHKLLQMVGIDGVCSGKITTGDGTRVLQYRLVKAIDIETKIAAKLADNCDRVHSLQRQRKRIETDSEVFNALDQVLKQRVENLTTTWDAIAAKVLEKAGLSRTSVRDLIPTEVLDNPDLQASIQDISALIHLAQESGAEVFHQLRQTIKPLYPDLWRTALVTVA
ncbi:DUF3854 domain-containing protein [Leptolyngbya sp. CCNP1308]|uniref:DUF3854 domain-containing protein n=1 Tax=Leptolyngbya sp. CCNP1308 TaxID=3110255 RepID=UPI002B21E45A|nr:DUF3854 domain-containing protein [Leptolyngbya sp. CCNP1308]MEA5449670.1 DUF3854 domain-containing protein [Leptolyngbya sp. CCNP1308]